jgi:hypothetical protein
MSPTTTPQYLSVARSQRVERRTARFIVTDQVQAGNRGKQMKFLLAALLALFATGASAQQQPASNVAVQITTAVGALALELDQARQTIADLRKQLIEAQSKAVKPEEKK